MPRKRDRKINEVFDHAVLDQLLLTVTENVNSVKQLRAVEIATDSYAIIEKAAKIAQRMEQFQ